MKSTVDGDCHTQIDSDSDRVADVTSWYEIWQAVVAIDGMCLRFKRAGGTYVGKTSDSLLCLSPSKFN